MLIGGLQKFSLLDYPGNISAIIFTQGCNFCCQFCYNPLLVLPHQSFFSKILTDKRNKFKYIGVNHSQQQKDHFKYNENDLFAFLKSRINKLDAVVITGGEPTIHKDLIEFITKIKKLNYLVKLDTNGSNPEVIKKLIDKKLLDYIAMDIKASKEKYQKVINKQIVLEKIEKSVKIIMTSNLPYEFRTTIMPEFFDQNDVFAIGELIKGADKWYLQKFKSDIELINPKLKNKESYSDQQMNEFAKIGQQYVKECKAR
ncbi:MAG: anaerobic ribonucleoside-triphosphate reductase activating protein [Patescibacteria group bacterium]|nr:anaerobic ribonucleoside-triphosphate reductase activating protein [Patescibacteria group bacterium]MBU1871035.1 anaerobic ribonucleoside-triphosphate reductase activating protein [Patescibacteria group bacterium]